MVASNTFASKDMPLLECVESQPFKLLQFGLRGVIRLKLDSVSAERLRRVAVYLLIGIF